MIIQYHLVNIIIQSALRHDTADCWIIIWYISYLYRSRVASPVFISRKAG